MAKQRYKGGCQCGAVSYMVNVDLDQTFTCNCSRCQRIGAVLAFAPADDFEFINDGPVTEYLFHKMIIHHRFCPTCGIESYAWGDGPDGFKMVAINANCLEGVDPRQLKSQHIDGASA